MKISLSKLGYGILFLLILTNNIISSYISFFRFFDELIAGFAIIYILLYLRGFNKSRFLVLYIVGLLVVICIGLIGNIVWNYQPSNVAIGKDIYAFIKCPVIGIALILRAKKKGNSDKALDAAYDISKFFVIITFVCGVLSQFINTSFTSGVRHGLKSYQFLYTHPTFLAYSLVLTSIILVAHDEDVKKNNMLIVLNLLTLILTMRDKAFGYVILFIIMVYVIPNDKKMKKSYIVFGGVLAAVIAYFVSRSKLIEYSTWSWSPRYALYTNGFDLMKKTLPTGSGFGTFASSISGSYYSKAYYLYGLQNRPGTNPVEFVDLGDAGFPYYYTQFGVIGFLLTALVIWKLFKYLLSYYKLSPNKVKAIYLGIGYIIIALLVEAILTNESGATIMVVLFLYLGGNTH